jgi:hypothetical protein
MAATSQQKVFKRVRNSSTKFLVFTSLKTHQASSLTAPSKVVDHKKQPQSAFTFKKAIRSFKRASSITSLAVVSLQTLILRTPLYSVTTLLFPATSPVFMFKDQKASQLL